MNEQWYELGKSMGAKGASHGMITAKLVKEGVHEIEARQIADASIAAVFNRKRMTGVGIVLCGGAITAVAYCLFSQLGLVRMPITIGSIGFMVMGVGVVTIFQRSRIKTKNTFVV